MLITKHFLIGYRKSQEMLKKPENLKVGFVCNIVLWVRQSFGIQYYTWICNYYFDRAIIKWVTALLSLTRGLDETPAEYP